MVAPPEPRGAVDHVDDTFQVTVMVRARLRFGIDRDGAGPQFSSSGSFSSYCGAALHPECLCRAIIKLIALDDSYAVRSPSRLCGHPGPPPFACVCAHVPGSTQARSGSTGPPPTDSTQRRRGRGTEPVS